MICLTGAWIKPEATTAQESHCQCPRPVPKPSGKLGRELFLPEPFLDAPQFLLQGKVGLGAAWGSGMWQEVEQMSFKAPSKPNHPRISLFQAAFHPSGHWVPVWVDKWAKMSNSQEKTTWPLLMMSITELRGHLCPTEAPQCWNSCGSPGQAPWMEGGVCHLPWGGTGSFRDSQPCCSSASPGSPGVGLESDT